MKKLFIVVLLFLGTIARAQDEAFLEKFNKIRTKGEARNIADSLSAHLKGKFVFYKMKEFDNGLLRIVYTPEGMSEDDIKAQNDYDKSFVADFRSATSSERAYVLDMVKAKYDLLFPVWKYWFSKGAQPDKKTQRYTNAEKGYQYSFINRGDVWAIGR